MSTILKNLTFHSFWILSIAIFIQCSSPKVESEVETDVDEAYSGGKEGTVFDQTANAFGNSLINLNSDEVDQFVIGNSFNRNNWVTAPSSTSARDGLGPFFNATSCSACHFQDGKGTPLMQINRSRNLYFSVYQFQEKENMVNRFLIRIMENSLIPERLSVWMQKGMFLLITRKCRVLILMEQPIL